MKDFVDYSRFDNFQKVLGMDTYIVKKGDTLSEIAYKHKTTVAELKNINQLPNDYIYPNQVLFVPNKAIEDIYITQPGDTLNSVISKLGIKLNLGEYDELLNIELAPNTEIKIEDKKRSNVVVYQGEDLKAFCFKYNVNEKKLLNLNYDNWFKRGSKIIIS